MRAFVETLIPNFPHEAFIVAQKQLASPHLKLRLRCFPQSFHSRQGIRQQFVHTFSRAFVEYWLHSDKA